MATPLETLDIALERFDAKAPEAHRYNDEWLVSTLPYLRTLLTKARRSLIEGNVTTESMIAMAIAEQIVKATKE